MDLSPLGREPRTSCPRGHPFSLTVSRRAWSNAVALTDPKFGIDDELTADDTAVTGVSAQTGDLVALTILHHPDLKRVGERCLLTSLRAHRPVQLSRNAPAFHQPGDRSRGLPLGDRRMSRTPHVMMQTNDHFEFRCAEGGKLVVNGRSAEVAAIRVDQQAMREGVVLELADRVTLLACLMAPPADAGAPRFSLVGDSTAVERLRSSIHRLRDIEVPVLLRGESGTGKELVARAIHAHGPRRDRPFVAVNIATTPGTIAASQLFGHVRGSFTGAHRDAPGLFRQADGGTLLLDEIGDASADVQVALLRVLETGEILPVGGQGSHRVDVRLIAATDADLEKGVERGTFRHALLHRLSGFQILVPPLRERRDDVGRLFAHFLREELETIGETDRLSGDDKRTWIPASLVGQLARYHWPGNVRELRNAVRQVVIANRGRPRYEMPSELARLLATPPSAASSLAGAAPVSPERNDEVGSALGSPLVTAPSVTAPSPGAAVPARPRTRPSAIGDDVLIAALEANDWRIAPTARDLGIARNSLLTLIDKSSKLKRPKDLGAAAIEKARTQHAGDLSHMAAELKVSEAGLKLRMRQLGLADD